MDPYWRPSCNLLPAFFLCFSELINQCFLDNFFHLCAIPPRIAVSPSLRRRWCRLLLNCNSETAGDENATSYFPLLDRIAEGYFKEAATDRDLYNAFVKVLQNDGHMDSEGLSSYSLALSLRTAAPRIEAQYQYYYTTIEPSVNEEDTSCPVWVLFGSKQHCSPSLDEPHSDFKGHA